MIATAFALPSALFASPCSTGVMAGHVLHSSYTDVMLAMMCRHQARLSDTDTLLGTDDMVSDLPIMRSRSCDSTFSPAFSKAASNKAAAQLQHQPPQPCASESRERGHKRRVSFSNPLVHIHEVERIVLLEEKRRPHASLVHDLLFTTTATRTKLSCAAMKSSNTVNKSNACEDAERKKLEERRWRQACKLARAVGVSYLVVSFGTTDDDIFEVECDADVVISAEGEGDDDSVFDYQLLNDHLLV